MRVASTRFLDAASMGFVRATPRAALIALLAACAADTPTEGGTADREPRLHQFLGSEWSEPVNLGPLVNSAANDNAPALSRNGLTLYFLSNRPGGAGGNDIWVARRDCVACPWQAPANVSAVNTPFNEGGPDLSIDGHLLFFVSNRPGGAGAEDIWISRRANPTDPLGWEPPQPLGPDVNTPVGERAPEYLQSAEDGAGNLYFDRGVPAGLSVDIYVAPIERNGETRGPAVAVSELNAPQANDAGATIRVDGREMYFRSGGPGRPEAAAGDLFVSTRASVHHPWEPPQLASAVNTEDDEIAPELSFDGRTLLFATRRPDGFGGFDIYMATRTPNGH